MSAVLALLMMPQCFGDLVYDKKVDEGELVIVSAKLDTGQKAHWIIACPFNLECKKYKIFDDDCNLTGVDLVFSAPKGHARVQGWMMIDHQTDWSEEPIPFEIEICKDDDPSQDDPVDIADPDIPDVGPPAVDNGIFEDLAKKTSQRCKTLNDPETAGKLAEALQKLIDLDSLPANREQACEAISDAVEDVLLNSPSSYNKPWLEIYRRPTSKFIKTLENKSQIIKALKYIISGLKDSKVSAASRYREPPKVLQPPIAAPFESSYQPFSQPAFTTPSLIHRRIYYPQNNQCRPGMPCYQGSPIPMTASPSRGQRLINFQPALIRVSR